MTERRPGAMLVAALVLGGGLAATGPTAAAEGCAQPEAVFVYDPDEIAYTIAVDLTGCKWLKKKQRFEVRGFLERDGGVGGERHEGASSCARRDGTCRLIIGMSHLPVEAARYSGEIAYTWNKKKVVLPLAKVCVSAGVEGSCLDE